MIDQQRSSQQVAGGAGGEEIPPKCDRNQDNEYGELEKLLVMRKQQNFPV